MKKLLTGPIHFYQKHISPATQPSCRYHPTCSTYALQAIEKHGAAKGGVMSLARIIRCNPFVEGGVDEVPDYFTVHRNPDNIDDFHFPEHLMPVDAGAREKLESLLEEYEDQLSIYEELPSSVAILEKIADPKELTAEEIRNYFTKDELDYLIDIDIFPNLSSDDFRYYTIGETENNERHLEVIEPYFEDTELGMNSPLLVLEKTGIWYTNIPNLAREFLVERGVTAADIENRSYHLWLVLNALNDLQNKEETGS